MRNRNEKNIDTGKNSHAVSAAANIPAIKNIQKKFNQFIIFSLVIIFIFSVFGGCTKNNVVATGYRINVKATDKKMIDNGQSKGIYLVYPDELEKNQIISFTVGDTQTLFEKSTGVRPEIKKESEVTVDSNSFYFYIGDTALSRQKAIQADYSLLSDAGISIKTDGNITFVTGATPRGAANAVYEMMSHVIGYECYAYDEVYLNNSNNVMWFDFDVFYKPTINNPCLMHGELNDANSAKIRRYRLENYYNTWIKINNTFNAHNYFMFLPKGLYQSEHANWYSPKGNNLCLTRDPAMIDEFTKKVQAAIEKDTQSSYMMLGQEDNFDFCDCSTCRAKIDEYGTASAVMMEFTNKVVQKLNVWLAESHPERNITFVTFAYNATKTPPVKKDADGKYQKDANGKYIPVNSAVVAEPNLSVQYVINLCDYYKKYREQPSIVEAMEGWSVVTNHMTIWEYSINFDDYFDTFDNWNSYADNIKFLSSYGVDYIVEQAAYNSNTSSFADLRIYLQSKLMWDSSLSTDDLINEFMTNYYKDAAKDMKKLFDATYAHVDKIVKESGAQVRSNGNEVMNMLNWSMFDLQTLQGIANDAIAALGGIKETDKKLYDKLYKRVEKSSLWIEYYYITFHKNFIDDYETRYERMKIKAGAYGISRKGEGAYW